MIKLHLLQELQYKKEEIEKNLSFPKTFELFNTKLQKIKNKGEFCIHCHYNCEDTLEIKVVEIGYRDAPTPQEKEAVDNLKPSIKMENPDFEISIGNYSAYQFSTILTKKNLIYSFIPLIQENEGDFYFRMIKENAIQIVLQVLFTS